MKVLFVGFGDIARRVAVALPPSATAVGLRRSPCTEQTAGVELRAVDVTDAQQLAAVLREPFDYVVATLTPSEMSEAGYRASYLAAARQLAELLPQHPSLQRIFWVSSSSVYGTGAEDQWVTEESEALPQRATAKVLLEAERCLADLPLTVLRFSGIYGPGRERMLSIVSGGGPLPGLRSQWSNRIHSDDGAAFIAYLMARDSQSEVVEPLYIVTDGEPARLGEVADWLAEQLQCPPVAVEQGTAQRGGKRLYNQRLRESGFVLRYPTYREGYKALLAAKNSLEN